MKYQYTARQKEIVELRKQGKTFQEIGVLLGVTKVTVRRLYQTAVRRLDLLLPQKICSITWSFNGKMRFSY